MSNLFGLVRRRWKVARTIHLAAVIISAAVLIGWLLLWGYVEATGHAAGSRVIVPPKPAELILKSPNGARAIGTPVYATEVYGYRDLPVSTSIGNLTLGAVSDRNPSTDLPQPVGDLLWVNRSLAEKWHLQVGERFPLRLREEWTFHQLETKIGGIFDRSAFLPDVLADGIWLSQQQVSLPNEETVFFNRRGIGEITADQQYSIWLKQLPAGVKEVSGNDLVSAARQIADDTMSSGGSVVVMLWFFLTLGVGTFSLLSYLDGRRELAVLKSLGLRPGEAWSLFYLESLITAAISWLLGVGLANLLASRLSVSIEFNAVIYGQSLLWMLAAVTAATAIPCLLGQRAGTIDLMFNRPVPLFSSRVTELRRHYPALESWLAAGYRCVKLPNPDGEFPGICLRQAGDKAKQGETIAWESYAFGLAERHYLAPCNGTVERCDLTQGLVAIKEQ